MYLDITAPNFLTGKASATLASALNEGPMPNVSGTVAPGTPPLGGHRGLTVRPGVGTALAAVSRPGWGGEARGARAHMMQRST